MRYLVAILVVLLLTLQYRLWVADGGLADVYRLQQRIDAQQQQNDRLRERNRALAAEVRDLKKGLAAVEGRARSELGMVGADETFYRVVEPPDAAPQDAKAAETQPGQRESRDP